MTICNINPQFGESNGSATFESPEEMAEAIKACGYDLPEDGLREGRDYREVVSE